MRLKITDSVRVAPIQLQIAQAMPLEYMGDAARVREFVASGASQVAGRAGDEDESHGEGASGAPQAAAREGDAAGVPDSKAERSDAQDTQSEGSDNASRASPFLLQERGRSRYRYNNRGYGRGNYYPSYPKYQGYVPHGGRHYYFPRNGEDAEGNEAVAGDSAGSSPNAAASRTSPGVDEDPGCCGNGEAERDGGSGYYNGPGGFVYGAASRHGAGSSKHADAENENPSA
ncbi:uncharacterized protein LOC125059088 [Pieris napi]|uniref:uncharacterized protein LOC125059088 n=1 Tax=Pieris napi TaxID=78633 RepID=UPI001FBA97AD|nr:uncharacterized protein LOC125059088 [Pieris napi]